MGEIVSPDYTVVLADKSDNPYLHAIKRGGSGIPARFVSDTHRKRGIGHSYRRAWREGHLRIAKAATAHGPVVFLLSDIVNGILLLRAVYVLPEYARECRLCVCRGEGSPGLYLTTFRRLPRNARFHAGLGFPVMEEAVLPDVVRRKLEGDWLMGFQNRIAIRWMPIAQR
ncbi:MAG: hypothetical protein LBJ46_02810 [Planctomycetota bacterium]|jgi:hypothetical protein|nr:hypothetical protein [Planctomycetota bacterium]